jgi:hypothetical protein
MSIGNLQPGSGVKVRVTLLSPLVGFDEKLFFALPAQFFPAASVKYRLQLKSSVALGPNSTTTYYLGSQRGVAANGVLDFSLNPTAPALFGVEITPGKPFEPLAIVEKSANGKLLNASVTFFPIWDHLDEDLLTPYVEVIFCVDRSGSMDGARIKAAATTLSLFLSSLPENCMVRQFCVFTFN